MLADGTVFEGEAVGGRVPGSGWLRRRGRWCSTPRTTGYQEVLDRPFLCRPDHLLHLSPHRQLRGSPYRTTRAGGPSAAASSSGTWLRRPSSWRSERTIGDFLPRHEKLPGPHRYRHPPWLTRHIREAGSMPAAFGPVGGTGALDEVHPQGGGGGPSRGPTGNGPGRPRSRPPTAIHGRRRPASGRGLRLRHKAGHPAPPLWGAWRTVEVVPASTAVGRRPRPPARRGLPIQRPGRPGRQSVTPRMPSSSCSVRCRSSASA